MWNKCITTRGFTMVEGLVSVALITMAFAAFTTLMVKSLQANQVVQEEFIAKTLSREGIELLINKKDNHVNCFNYGACAPPAWTHWTNNIIPSGSSVTFEIDGLDSNILLPNRAITALAGAPRPMCVKTNPPKDAGFYSYCSPGQGDPIPPGDMTRTVSVRKLNDYSIEVTSTVRWRGGANAITLTAILFATA